MRAPQCGRSVTLTALLLLGGTAHAQAGAQASLEQLVEQLGSADANQRNQAYQELQRRRSPDAVPLLAKAIAALPQTAQQYAVWLLEQQPAEATKPVWRKLIDADAAYLRAVGAAHLWRTGDKSHAATLAKALGELPAEQRLPACNLLWNVDDERVLAALRSWLKSGQRPEVVRQALQQLQQNEKGRNEATIAAATALLDDPDALVRIAARASLIAAGEAGHGKALAELLRAQPDQLGFVRQFLERSPRLEPELVDAIADALRAARSKFDVTLTASLLQKQSAEKAAAALRPLLEHSNADIRSGALEALAAIPGALDQKQLRAMLQGSDVQQQLIAAGTLRRMDDPSGLPVVIALLPKAGTHKAEAARVLGGFRHREAVPPLLDLLDDADQPTRFAAWNGLQNVLRGLFPYRRFDFAKSGYEPNSGARAGGIATVRAWWTAAAAGR